MYASTDSPPALITESSKRNTWKRTPKKLKIKPKSDPTSNQFQINLLCSSQNLGETQNRACSKSLCKGLNVSTRNLRRLQETLIFARNPGLDSKDLVPILCFIYLWTEELRWSCEISIYASQRTNSSMSSTKVTYSWNKPHIRCSVCNISNRKNLETTLLK